jgi:hypothetical protein
MPDAQPVDNATVRALAVHSVRMIREGQQPGGPAALTWPAPRFPTTATAGYATGPSAPLP